MLLVGGGSTRFGSPKALALLGGETLAERGWRVLGEACDEVIAVGKAADALPLPLPLVDDGTNDRAPVYGVIAGLRAAAHDVAVFLPVDCPLVTPELLRLKGEFFLLHSTPAITEMAEELFRQALDAARRQEALSWELRAATSLARLLCDQSRSADAIACLQPVYGRFTEGFDTADLIAAKQLLDELVDRI